MFLPFIPRSRRTTAGLFAVGCLLCGPAFGQTRDKLAIRIGTAEAQSQHLSQQIDKISAATGEIKVAALFGESDEERAARLANEQREQAQSSSIATLNQRLGDLEETLRRLTGEVEDLNHRMGDFNDRLSRVRREFDYKICALAAQQLGASGNSGQENALPCGASAQSSASPPPSVPTSPANPVHLAPPPGTLGTLPRSELSQPTQAPTNQMASLDTRPQFEAALTMLAKAQYDEARAAFRGFADMFPRDELASQAVYWVGDIAFVQRDYPGAARAFAEELKKYPDSPRAADSMLKLGQSLLALNQKKEGCRALGTLANQYPTASKSITDQALAARKTAGCR